MVACISNGRNGKAEMLEGKVVLGRKNDTLMAPAT